jgi:tetrapyrrole methylase family protein / MazG family protein
MTLVLRDLERVLAQVGEEVGDYRLQITTAAAVAGQYYPQLDAGQPALLSGLSGPELARRVQQTLLQAYPPEHGVRVLAGGEVEKTELGRLAEASGLGEDVWLFVPPLPEPGDYNGLQEVVARLRAPDGCPWDRELTWDKLRAYLLEESYELLAALDSRDPAKVAEEQGDLLLQIAMQAQIALEEGLFRPTDVIQGIVTKLIRRHPHVFGDATVSGTEEVLANWEAIKRTERENNHEKRSPLSGVPAQLPALAQAQAYLDRMARLEELHAPEAPWERLASLPAGAPVTPELVGEALLGLVAWARERDIDAESALRAANARYAARVASELGDTAQKAR